MVSTTNSNADDLTRLVEAASTSTLSTEKMAVGLSCVVVRVGGRWFALPGESITTVVTERAVTRVPSAPPHVLGIALIQSRLLLVVSADELLPPAIPGESALTLPRFVVVTDGTTEIAIATDEAQGLVTLNLVGPRSEGRGPIVGELFWEDKLISCLDPAAIVALALEKAP